MNSGYFMRLTLWETVILYMFLCIFHFLCLPWSWEITFKPEKKKIKKERMVGRKDLAVICQDMLGLILKFCLKFTSDFNVRETQETKNLKSCE